MSSLSTDGTVRSVLDTRRARELWDSILRDTKEEYPDLKVGLVQTWEDGFEPNNVKRDRDSAWTGLFYLIPPKEETGEQNSFIISLGVRRAPYPTRRL